jgi:Ca2+-transporting ATPase
VTTLETDVAAGLDDAEARSRLERYGPNTLDVGGGPSRFSILLDQFRDVLIWLLLVAAAVSGVLLDEWIDAFVILAIVILNAVIGFVQEVRAEDALAALQEMSAPEALVRRNDNDQRVPSADVVPGDVVVLEAGDRIPADARLVEVVHLQADESALTGESLPVDKSTRPAEEDAGVGDRRSMVFAGTSVAAGRGVAVVVETGLSTEVGKIAEMLNVEEPETPLTKELDRTGKRIAILTVLIALLIFGLGLLRDIELETMFLSAVALAVAAIPEGLPAVVTVTLSRGVTKMARNNAIVRRLQAVETLGSASVICSDKTGTLTRNEMRVQQIAFADLEVSADRASDRHGTQIEQLALVAALCSDARPTQDGYLGDPTEVAVLRAVHPVIVDAVALRRDMPRVDEVAFDSARKRMTTIHEQDGQYLVAVKGAPEVLLERATRLLESDGPVALGDDRRREAHALADDYASRGLRTLGFAYRTVDAIPDDPADLETDLIMVSIVGMSDELRPEARPAVEDAKRAGIRVVMVTGDHAVTAGAIAGDLEMLEDHAVMAGPELRTTSEEELAAKVHDYGVYARVDPADKVKIVRAWQENGDIVAMTGDGVNDAPALRAADIGVAMGTGTDVAKEASEMVLADDNFATIIKAVREGRTIFSNLKKVVYFLLSANLSEVGVMLMGFLFFGALGEPLLATQLLWVNLVTDGLPAIALGVDAAVPGLMSRGPKIDRDILGPSHQLRLLWQGSVLALAVMGAYVWGHTIQGYEWEYVRTVAFMTLVLVQLLHVFNVRAQGTTAFAFGVTSNPLLLWGIAGSLALQLLVIYTPAGQSLFETQAIAATEWVVIIVLSVMSFLVVDGIKRWTMTRHPDRGAALD